MAPTPPATSNMRSNWAKEGSRTPYGPSIWSFWFLVRRVEAWAREARVLV